MNAIPAAGRSGLLGSYISAVQFLRDAPAFLQDGYVKYKGRAFRVPHLTHWTIIVSGNLIDEFFQLPSKVASLQDAVREMLQADYTLGRTLITNPYHIPLVRKLRNRIDAYFPGVHEELVRVVDRELSSSSGEWVRVEGFNLMLTAFGHASNRVLVGPALCRDDRFISICIEYSHEVIKAAALLYVLPKWCKPYILRLASRLFKTNRYINTAALILRPLIKERRVTATTDLNRGDMLDWLLERADVSESDVISLTRRILTLNFAALHTTTLTFTHALYHAAAHPAYADALREELMPVYRTDWTWSALDALPVLNSFLKETQRLEGLGCLSLARKARESFTLSDGTTVPAGAFVAVAGTAVHRDSDDFEDPLAFNPWRFAHEDQGFARAQNITNTSSTHLAFGHGRTACPGRFFAAMEMKTLLAHLVIHYDIKFDGDGRRPPNKWFSIHCIPDPHAKLMFRRRAAEIQE
ncbi:cytochrome P450 [Schizophyllum commune]